MLGIPGAGSKGGGKPVDDALLDTRLEQRPHRLGAADSRVEESLGTSPKCLEEAVETVARRGDSLYTRAPSEGSRHIVDSGEPRPLLDKSLVQIILLPGGQAVECECEDHDRSARDPSKLGEAGAGGLPVVDRRAGHRCIDGAVVEGELLRAGDDRRRGSTMRCARIVALGSTASTQRSRGS